MFNRLRRLLPHAAILICNMYVVFYLIDRVNTAMNFIDNGLTKGLLLALCVIALVNCRALLRLDTQPHRPFAPSRAPAYNGRYGARASERRGQVYPTNRQTHVYGDGTGARRRPNDDDRRYADGYEYRRANSYARGGSESYNRRRASSYDRQRSGDYDQRRTDEWDHYERRRTVTRDYEERGR